MGDPKTIDPGGPPERLAWLDREVRAASLLELFVDFDGTLVELADRPESARLEPFVGRMLARLADRHGVRVAIISGRTVEDLRLQLPPEALYLAGNHGLEVIGPTIRFLHRGAAERIGQMEALTGELTVALASIPGSFVENKRLSIACHSRAVPAEYESTFRSEVLRVLSRHTGPWRVLTGKRVIEILPSPDWTKGSCARLLMTHFESQTDGSPDSFAVAIGDDLSDRDLLAEVLDRGCAITVGDSLGSGWCLEVTGVPGVHRLLERFDLLRAGRATAES